ncbi:hypothetical protein B1B04_18095 [Lysinibacillus sp. KCTC 33748]|nr:hypothetical protein B1B04_18095 [Lysinibacillus sp. KCTC 33748]
MLLASVPLLLIPKESPNLHYNQQLINQNKHKIMRIIKLMLISTPSWRFQRKLIPPELPLSAKNQQLLIIRICRKAVSKEYSGVKPLKPYLNYNEVYFDYFSSKVNLSLEENRTVLMLLAISYMAGSID